jgi:hypothetical protein
LTGAGAVCGDTLPFLIALMKRPRCGAWARDLTDDAAKRAVGTEEGAL